MDAPAENELIHSIADVRRIADEVLHGAAAVYRLAVGEREAGERLTLFNA